MGEGNDSIAPFVNGGAVSPLAAGGWPGEVYGPSAVAHSDALVVPKEMTSADMERVVKAFVDAAKRAVRVGFDVVEIMSAHGFLLNSFISPVANKRTDAYGGSFENRIRFPLEIVDAVRAVIPPTMPLFFRCVFFWPYTFSIPY